MQKLKIFKRIIANNRNTFNFTSQQIVNESTLCISIENKIDTIFRNQDKNENTFSQYLDQIQQLENEQLATKYFKFIPKIIQSESLSSSDLQKLIDLLLTNKVLEVSCRLSQNNMILLMNHLQNQDLSLSQINQLVSLFIRQFALLMNNLDVVQLKSQIAEVLQESQMTELVQKQPEMQDIILESLDRVIYRKTVNLEQLLSLVKSLTTIVNEQQLLLRVIKVLMQMTDSNQEIDRTVILQLLSVFQDKVHIDIYKELVGDIQSLELQSQLTLLLASDPSGIHDEFEDTVRKQVLAQYKVMNSIQYIMMINYLNARGMNTDLYDWQDRLHAITSSLQTLFQLITVHKDKKTYLQHVTQFLGFVLKTCNNKQICMNIGEQLTHILVTYHSIMPAQSKYDLIFMWLRQGGSLDNNEYLLDEQQIVKANSDTWRTLLMMQKQIGDNRKYINIMQSVQAMVVQESQESQLNVVNTLRLFQLHANASLLAPQLNKQLKTASFQHLLIFLSETCFYKNQQIFDAFLKSICICISKQPFLDLHQLHLLIHHLQQNISTLHRKQYLQFYDKLRYLMDILEFRILENVLDMQAYVNKTNKYNPFLDTTETISSEMQDVKIKKSMNGETFIQYLKIMQIMNQFNFGGKMMYTLFNRLFDRYITQIDKSMQLQSLELYTQVFLRNKHLEGKIDKMLSDIKADNYQDTLVILRYLCVFEHSDIQLVERIQGQLLDKINKMSLSSLPDMHINYLQECLSFTQLHYRLECNYNQLDTLAELYRNVQNNRIKVKTSFVMQVQQFLDFKQYLYQQDTGNNPLGYVFWFKVEPDGFLMIVDQEDYLANTKHIRSHFEFQRRLLKLFNVRTRLIEFSQYVRQAKRLDKNNYLQQQLLKLNQKPASKMRKYFYDY